MAQSPDAKFDRYKLKIWGAVRRATRAGVEGVSFAELVVYMRLRGIFEGNLPENFTPAQAFQIIRVCQGDVPDNFTDYVLAAVEALAEDGRVLIDDQATIFLTARGHQEPPQEKESNE